MYNYAVSMNTPLVNRVYGRKLFLRGEVRKKLKKKTRIPAGSYLVVYMYRGDWSYYYMHGAAPITQYMAASTR